MCRGPSQEVPCPPQGPATDQALESVSCQEQAPSGLISSGGKRHFVGRLSDSICVSCGPVARHLCWTRRTRELEEGRYGRRRGVLGQREPGDRTVVTWWLQGVSASTADMGMGGIQGGNAPMTPAPHPRSASPLSTGCWLPPSSPAGKMHKYLFFGFFWTSQDYQLFSVLVCSLHQRCKPQGSGLGS